MILSSLPHNLLLAQLATYEQSKLRENHLGQIIQISFEKISDVITLKVCPDYLESIDLTEHSDLRISATPSQFIDFLLEKKSSIAIEGDLTLAQNFQLFLSQTYINYPEILSDVFGPLIGSQLAQAVPMIHRHVNQVLSFISDSLNSQSEARSQYENIVTTIKKCEERLDKLNIQTQRSNP